MTTQDDLNAWQAANAVLAARFPNERFNDVLERLRDVGDVLLSLEEQRAFSHRREVEQEIVSRLAFHWKAFLATRLEQRPHQGLGVEDVLKRLDSHRQQHVAAIALASPIKQIMDLLEGPPEERRSEALVELTQAIQEKLEVAAALFPAIPSIAAVSGTAPAEAPGGLEQWLEEVKQQAVVPALIASMKQQNELMGFGTYDFQLFMADRVPSGDPRLVEWANESGLSLFYQLNEAAAKPEPVVSLGPRAFRPR